MSEDPDVPRKPKPAHALGEPLDLVSIEEIDARIELLRAEIARLEAARRSKAAAKSAADAFFKK
jgi:uncharacterized small protein (DUF1192 family)